MPNNYQIKSDMAFLESTVPQGSQQICLRVQAPEELFGKYTPL